MSNVSVPTSKDHAGVWVPPPLLYVVIFLAGMLLQQLLPLPLRPVRLLQRLQRRLTQPGNLDRNTPRVDLASANGRLMQANSSASTSVQTNPGRRNSRFAQTTCPGLCCRTPSACPLI